MRNCGAACEILFWKRGFLEIPPHTDGIGGRLANKPKLELPSRAGAQIIGEQVPRAGQRHTNAEKESAGLLKFLTTVAFAAAVAAAAPETILLVKASAPAPARAVIN